MIYFKAEPMIRSDTLNDHNGNGTLIKMTKEAII